jgi:hypothetical protein
MMVDYIRQKERREEKKEKRGTLILKRPFCTRLAE